MSVVFVTGHCSLRTIGSLGPNRRALEAEVRLVGLVWSLIAQAQMRITTSLNWLSAQELVHACRPWLSSCPLSPNFKLQTPNDDDEEEPQQPEVEPEVAEVQK